MFPVLRKLTDSQQPWSQLGEPPAEQPVLGSCCLCYLVCHRAVCQLRCSLKIPGREHIDSVRNTDAELGLVGFGDYPGVQNQRCVSKYVVFVLVLLRTQA